MDWKKEYRVSDLFRREKAGKEPEPGPAADAPREPEPGVVVRQGQDGPRVPLGELTAREHPEHGLG